MNNSDFTLASKRLSTSNLGDQIDRLMLLLNMPSEHRPPGSLTLAQRTNKIIEWAHRKPGGLADLDARLRTLIEQQYLDEVVQGHRR